MFSLRYFIIGICLMIMLTSYAQPNDKCKNNSDALSLDQLSNCIGKHIDSAEVRSVFVTLGEDSSVFKSKQHISVDYFCDKVSFAFDRMRMTEVQLTGLFVAKSKLFEDVGRNRTLIEQKIGAPTNEQLFNCVTFTDDGKELERPCNYECYYASKKLKVLYDLSGNVEIITLAERE